MNNIFFLQGAPGCGKSTFIREHGLESLAISPDAMRAIVNPAPSVYNHTTHRMEHGYDFSSRTSKATFIMTEKVCEERMRRGETVIVDSIAAKRRIIGGLLHRANTYDYAVHFVDMQGGLTIDEILRRNSSRGSRAVPEDVVRTAFDNCGTFEIMNGEDRITAEQMLAYAFIKEVNLDAYDSVSVIGDIQGCFGKFHKSGRDRDNQKTFTVFAGDLFDRGPDDESAPLFEWLNEHITDADKAFVIGNHDSYLRFWGDGDHESIFGRSTRQTVENILRDSRMVSHSPKKLHHLARTMYRHMTPMFAFSFRGGHYVVSHGGLHPSILDGNRVKGGYNMGFMPYMDFWYGSGTTVDTGDYRIDIDKVIEEDRRETSPIQFHGHRNEYRHEPDRYRHVFNLEQRVEHDGYLAIARIDRNGAITIERY